MNVGRCVKWDILLNEYVIYLYLQTLDINRYETFL